MIGRREEQGLFGCRELVACAGTLAWSPSKLEPIFEVKEKNQNGIFCFRRFFMGFRHHWNIRSYLPVEVVIYSLPFLYKKKAGLAFWVANMFSDAVRFDVGQLPWPSGMKTIAELIVLLFPQCAKSLHPSILFVGEQMPFLRAGLLSHKGESRLESLMLP